ncbi:hypothetical protein LX32DRAFT_717265 [Colletotrichum zoysiae]|uniref:2EXR domain-containing protein n=1 Tax=Colletotrichum zoysiae TaxID=1216348 RepID=A0AAD9HLR9_9PEZI|nr:hypothetical protein LX32DRAFT_717265 [Colletotrichum zoysiae]
MAAFGLFGCLPVELRLKIWGFGLEKPEGFRTEYPLFSFRPRPRHKKERLPVASAVCRESRKEFLRLYVRFLDPQAPAASSRHSHGDASPLVLGIHVDYEASIGRGVPSVEHEQYTLGYMIDAPVLSRFVREQIQSVRLHDVDFVARVQGCVRNGDSSLDVGSPEGLGVFRLPPLLFPNLSTIQIVGLSMSKANLKAFFGSCDRSHYEVTFWYSKSSGRVYPYIFWIAGAVRLSLGLSRTWPRVFIKIQFVNEDSRPYLREVESLEDFSPAYYSLWKISAHYVALRLGEDQSRG